MSLASTCKPASILVVVLFFTPAAVFCQNTNNPAPGSSLNSEQVENLARLALKGLDQEFPNKPGIVLAGTESLIPPREMFPAFYGCFDWHSSIHGHWMLVRLIRNYPDHALVPEIRARLDSHLSAENLSKEADFFALPHNKSFERMYGWAWAFRLINELESWDDSQGNKWRDNMRPLEAVLRNRVMDYLPLLEWPIRTGVHPDTGFALGQILDYSRGVDDKALEELICARATAWFGEDRDYPARYEPSGEDFFSTGLNEADLMRRVYSPEQFRVWLDAFMPQLGREGEFRLHEPVKVSDVTDGKLVHLAGLNFSRAWCLQSIAHSLPDQDPRKEVLVKAAADHSRAGFEYVFSGHYEGEHWLGTFAVYVLTRSGIDQPR